MHGDGTQPQRSMANWVSGGMEASDLTCPMYPQIEAIRQYGADGIGTRPLIMCEYSHAMGNSNGSLADYWQVITSTPGLQGGFIWEWKDHGLRRRLSDGSERLAYGGDFGDTPNDGNFVADGLMSADLEPHPAMREVAWVYRPVTVSLQGRASARSLRITNRRSFIGLDDLVASWELLVGGEVVEARPPASAEGRPARVGDGAAAVPGTARSRRGAAQRSLAFASRRMVGAEGPPRRVGSGRVARGACAVRPSSGRSIVDDPLPRSTTSWSCRSSWRCGGPRPTTTGSSSCPSCRRGWVSAGRRCDCGKKPACTTRPPTSWSITGADRSVSDDGREVVYRHRVRVPGALADLPRVGVRFCAARQVPRAALVRSWSARELPRPQGQCDARRVDRHPRRAPVSRSAGVRPAHRHAVAGVCRSAVR